MPTHLFALGLGKINVHSFLSQPLDAEIDLVSANPDEIEDVHVKLADGNVFQAAGLDRPFLLTKLKFETRLDSQGQPKVMVTSDNAIREPFLNFIVQMRSREGVVRRTYAILLDPPSYRPEVQPVTQQLTVNKAADRSPAVAQSSATTYGPVKRAETLWVIADKIRPDQQVTIEQMMIALQQSNEHAFVGSNINNLRVGSILDIPPRSDIERTDPTTARQLFLAQTSNWQQRSQLTAAAPARRAEGTVLASEMTNTPQTPAASRRGSLRVVGVGREWLLDLDSHPGEKVYPFSPDEQLREEIADTEQDLSAVKDINRDLGDLKLALETKIETLQAALAEKDKTIAELQKQLATVQGEATSGDSAKDAVAATGTHALTPATDSGNGDAVVADADPATPGAIDISQPLPAQPEQNAQPSTKPESAQQEQLKPIEPVQPFWKNERWFIGGGVIASGLLLLLFLFLRRTRKREEEVENLLIPTTGGYKGEAEQIEEDLLLGGVFEESQEVELEGSDENVSTTADYIEPPADIAAVLTEADIYLAYRRYTPAETLIKEAMETSPSNPELKAKLLEIYAFKKDKASYREYLDEVGEELFQHSFELKERVMEMTRDLIPDHPLVVEERAAAPTPLPEQSAQVLDIDSIPALFKDSPASPDDISIDDLMVEDEEATAPAEEVIEGLGLPDDLELTDELEIPQTLEMPEELELELVAHADATEPDVLQIDPEAFNALNDDFDVVEEISIEPKDDKAP
ncbi:MAG: hypothetical protein MI754_03925 [Chromatiales bacterium]|nr:hypothetical protein [Chromatiales bacterium]